MANIQVRNVPEDVHNRLKSQASAAGKSLNEYLLARMTEMTKKLTMEEFNALIRARGPAPDTTHENPVVAMRRARDAAEERAFRAVDGDPPE